MMDPNLNVCTMWLWYVMWQWGKGGIYDKIIYNFGPLMLQHIEQAAANRLNRPNSETDANHRVRRT